MLSAYLTLGLNLDATDNEIRKAYLALIKAHPPETDPSVFQDITMAYEKIKDHRSRIHTRIFNEIHLEDLEGIILNLNAQKKRKKKRIGFHQLLHSLQKES